VPSVFLTDIESFVYDAIDCDFVPFIFLWLPRLYSGWDTRCSAEYIREDYGQGTVK